MQLNIWIQSLSFSQPSISLAEEFSLTVDTAWREAHTCWRDFKLKFKCSYFTAVSCCRNITVLCFLPPPPPPPPAVQTEEELELVSEVNRLPRIFSLVDVVSNSCVISPSMSVTPSANASPPWVWLSGTGAVTRLERRTRLERQSTRWTQSIRATDARWTNQLVALVPGRFGLWSALRICLLQAQCPIIDLDFSRQMRQADQTVGCYVQPDSQNKWFYFPCNP